MGISEVRSPNNSTRDMPNAQRGISPGAYSNPSNSRQRADGGHLAHNVGKAGSMPAARRDGVSGTTRDGVTESAPPTVGGRQDPLDPR
jgi:hypothetical protein